MKKWSRTRCADVAELADALDSGSSSRKGVEVQVLSSAPTFYGRPQGRILGMAGLDFELRGKLAVVTGGANGIGLAAARLLAANGADVWIFDLEGANLHEAAQQIGAKARATDVSRRESIDAAFAAAGTPEIVIANAGIVREADF